MNHPRLLHYGHPNRLLSVEEVVEPAYQLLVAHLQGEGLSEEEIALAVESLAQAHIDSLRANTKAEVGLTKAGRTTGLTGIVDLPLPGSIWAPVASAMMWGLLITAILFAQWPHPTYPRVAVQSGATRRVLIPAVWLLIEPPAGALLR